MEIDEHTISQVGSSEVSSARCEHVKILKISGWIGPFHPNSQLPSRPTPDVAIIWETMAPVPLHAIVPAGAILPIAWSECSDHRRHHHRQSHRHRRQGRH